MNIYHVQRRTPSDKYEAYHDFVVVAESAAKARKIHPDRKRVWYKGLWHYTEKFKRVFAKKHGHGPGGDMSPTDSLWVESTAENLKVTLIGYYVRGLAGGHVICRGREE